MNNIIYVRGRKRCLFQKKSAYFGARRIIYFSAEQLQVEELQNIGEEISTIVIDDLQTLVYYDTYQEIWKEIERLVLNDDIWLILVSRGKIPKWLKSVSIKNLS